jgi:hypothetical protein
MRTPVQKATTLHEYKLRGPLSDIFNIFGSSTKPNWQPLRSSESKLEEA